MGARRYGISLQATMYYFVYLVDTIAFYWQEKSSLLMNKKKKERIYNPRKKVVKHVGDYYKAQVEIKRLLEPAHSCYGLILYRFLGLVESRYSWIRFMWTFKTYIINFLLFLGSCVIRKHVHSSWWELVKRLCGLKVGWAEFMRQTVSFLLVCVFLGPRVGWMGIIRHQMLL